jgi:hypothetical protein
MKIAGFEFIEGARFQAGATASANEVGGHLELIRKEKKGEITPNDLVADAEHDNSPLHGFFEWDQGKAAHEHRLDQARRLIRSVVAIYVTDNQPAVRMHAYTHVREGETSHYRETSHALSQKKTRELVLLQAWRELRAWRDRYRHLEAFAKLIPVIEEILDKRSSE